MPLPDFPADPAQPLRLRARWAFLGGVDGIEPVADATVELQGDRLVAVSDRPDSRAVDLGNAAIVPGLVNAHAHLEFADLAEPLAPPRPFTQWIRAVLAHRRERREPIGALVRRGADEAARTGTVTLGEIQTDDDALTESLDAPRIVAFREIIGLLPETFDERFAIAERHLARGAAVLRSPLEKTPYSQPLSPADRGEGGGRRCGLSPHAPYSVHPDLLERLLRLARERHAPVAMHVAETAAELELLRDGTGEFAEMLQAFGLWRPGLLPTGRRPLDVLDRLATAPHALVVHGNHLDDDELAFLASQPSLTLVYCPRTHAYFGHPPHPWRTVATRGGNVAFGTDGRSTNPDLDLWRDVQFVRRTQPDVDPRLLLSIAVGRRCPLFRDDDLGRPGSRADFAIVSLDGATGTEPFDLLLQPSTRIVTTLHEGRRCDRRTP